ncbi:hypothetical protein [Actinomadura sp. 21ATH]|uniref:hypothetical protein n=1 Tax=Actinomadura sp. 21ATH TaxID=1735444 RepID=UPI0035C04E4D
MTAVQLVRDGAVGQAIFKGHLAWLCGTLYMAMAAVLGLQVFRLLRWSYRRARRVRS